MRRSRLFGTGLLLFGMALWVSILRGPVSAQDRAFDQRTKWEYKTLYPDDRDEALMLNTLN